MTKDESKIRNLKSKFVWIIFASIVVFVYFFALGSISLLGPDESRYSQVAREMFERNDFVTPTLGGFNWFEKPALLYWLQIVSYKIFGVSEFAARFGSALFGLGTIFSLWILGKAVSSQRSAVSRDFVRDEQAIDDSRLTIHDLPNWLFIIAASSIGLLAFSRGASFDIILTFPITAALVAFFIFDQAEKKSGFTFHFSLFTFHFFIGVALLAKGLIGIVFPLAIVAFYYVLSRRLPNKTFVSSLLWGTLLSLAVAALWYVPMYLTNGWTFIDEFFIQHHFARYTSNKYQHPQPFWFFLLVLPLMTLPWLPFFLASVWGLIKVQGSKFKVQRQENSSTLNSSNSKLQTFALAWLLVPLVFFSFSGSKLPGYILPALPAALILTAEYVSRFVRNNRKRRIALQALAFTTFACVVIILQFFVMNFARDETVETLIETADAQGYASEKILSFNVISHNAEFYGAGRLVRAADGKQRRFFSIAEMLEEMKSAGVKKALVFAPLEYSADLTQSDSVEAKVLGDNSRLAIFLIKSK
ncbi:MAG: glycosyltransferase family 39 protein [Acidobacteriota bacterium]|nr:glycosyltransferase family 39 protein [Acidobacteriota bacterium]